MEAKSGIKVYIDEPDAKAWVLPEFLSDAEQQALMAHLVETVPFIQHTLYVNSDHPRKQARLSCSMGNSYAYSGSVHPVSPWNERVQEIMQRVNQLCGCHFNSCLLNYYRHGGEYISAHSDDERSLDAKGQVVSVSLGAERVMTIRRKNMQGKSVQIPLPPGSLFMMEGKYFQTRFTHGIDRATAPVGPRLSLTYRCFRSKPTSTTKNNDDTNEEEDTRPRLF